MSSARLATRVAAALLAAALVVFLLANARSIDPATHSRVIANLSAMQELDSELDEIVLKLRDALLNNYDPLVATFELIKSRQRDLEQGEHAIVGRGETELDSAMAEVSGKLAGKEALIEQFKSRNALLRNSFYYFPLSVDGLSRDPQVPPAVRAHAQALLRDMLLLRLGATPADYELIALAIDQLRRQQRPYPPSIRARLEIVLQHARNVLAHQEELDRLVRDITAADIRNVGKSLTEAYNRVFERELKQANLYRFILLLVSLGLLTYAVFSFLRLRDNAAELRKALDTQAKEIVEREQAEFALQQSEARYRHLFESNPQPTYVHDNETLRFLAVNEAAIEQYGYSREEFLAMTLKDIRPLEDVPALIESLTAAYDQIVTRRLRRHKKKDGTLIEVEISSHELSFFDRPARLTLAIDVTEKRRAEEQLRLAASALEHAAEGVMISDESHRIVSVNKAFKRITGYARSEVIGRDPEFLRSGKHDAAFFEELWNEIRNTGTWKGELWRRRKSGEIYPEWRSISAVQDPSGKVTHYVSVFSDISQLKQAKARLEFLAHHDVLTGLPNRTLFEDRLQEALHRAHRHGAIVGLLFIDLDHFKHINDSLGHGVGDQMLQGVAARLRAQVRETDTVARLGGDEFTVLLDELAESGTAAIVAEKLRAALAEPLVVGNQELFISGSIGISCYPQDGGDAQTLLKNADAAMYRAKERGRDNYQYFSADMNVQALDRLLMTNSLRLALERDEFLLDYQPIVNLASGQVVALEALLRWRHPELGIVPPGRFIPLAEDTGLIVPIGDWVLKSACTQMKAWQNQGFALQRMAVNLSARQFKQKDLAQRIEAILHETRLAARFLELEITESMVMEDPAEAEKVLDQLHAIGIHLAIDDFGTGYSSLSYLKRFPIDFLKIDRSFVRDLPDNPDDVAITRAIVGLAKSLEMWVIAEGVETERQRAFLKAEGCEEAQGYLLSKPVGAEQIAHLLTDGERFPRHGAAHPV